MKGGAATQHPAGTPGAATEGQGWYRLTAEAEAAVPSPSLLVYPERVKRNIQRMLELVGGDVARLRPHVKTHKLGPVIRMQLEAGITKFKCATIAEAEMAATAGAPDVLLAYQPVGPNIERMTHLCEAFPETQFSVTVDDAGIVDAIAAKFSEGGGELPAYVDVDCGMHRTGAGNAGKIVELCERIRNAKGLSFAGLHVYDGHIHDVEMGTRDSRYEAAIAPVEEILALLKEKGIEPPSVVGGGSPTFALHANRRRWECSPGTTLFWDSGYGEKFPELGFEPAAALITRVISKPGAGRLCLDLGHKAVAAENPLERRVRFPDLPEAVPVMQSEEHLVIETARAGEIPVGAVFYGIPWHICPTVALYSEAGVVREGRVEEWWQVSARARRITI